MQLLKLGALEHEVHPFNFLRIAVDYIHDDNIFVRGDSKVILDLLFDSPVVKLDPSLFCKSST